MAIEEKIIMTRKIIIIITFLLLITSLFYNGVHIIP